MWFVGEVAARHGVTSSLQTIQNATTSEAACNSIVNYDTSCAFRGDINYPPYLASCTEEPPPPAPADVLMSGTTLFPDQYVDSSNGSYRFIYQGDGNLVLYGPNGPVWATMTFQVGRTMMQRDGNLVVYNSAGQLLWHTNTWGNPGAWLRVENDGRLVIYSSGGSVLWQSS